MSEGFFQLLIFAAIFLFLPALEGALRRRKQERSGGLPMPQPEWEDEEGPEFEPAGPEEWGETSGPARGHPTQSSEDLLPADLWEELRALARGERTLEQDVQPKPRPEPAAQPPTSEASQKWQLEPRPPPQADVPDFDTHGRPEPERFSEARALPPKPRPRERSGQVGEPSVPRPTGGLGDFPEALESPIGADGSRTVRSATSDAGTTAAFLSDLRHMAGSDLRRAVIFREVLDPPISERDE